MSQLDLMSVPLILSVPHFGFWDTSTCLFGAELCSAAGGCFLPGSVTTRRCFDSEWLLRSSPPSPMAYDLPMTEWLSSILNDEIVVSLRDSKLIWARGDHSPDDARYHSAPPSPRPHPALASPPPSALPHSSWQHYSAALNTYSDLLPTLTQISCC
ncbi:hypothetical protein K438DRAFT_1997491 [Mycena galopus ATCC 62051]|nr:hypothetical protein K438DRAFT_1997491 [Mycena galopus ATCC 62051]